MYKTLLILIMLLTGCFSQGEQSTGTSVIVSPDWSGSRIENARWSSDGNKISYIQDGDLWVKNLKTKQSKKIVSNSKTSNAEWIDSERILYYVSDGSGKLRGDLWIQSVASGENVLYRKEVGFYGTSSIFKNNIYLGYGKNGVKILNITDSNGQTNDIDLQIPIGISFKVSPNQDKISFFDGRKENLYLYDIKTQKIEQIDSLKKFSIYGYCWSPDGRFIAFAGETLNNRVPTLYVYKLGNDTPIEVKPIPGNGGDMDWSPTGKQIVITTVGQPCGNEILLMNIPSELLQ